LKKLMLRAPAWRPMSLVLAGCCCAATLSLAAADPTRSPGEVAGTATAPCRSTSELKPGPRKRALIVAISHYAIGTHWPEIDSLNDVPLVQGALAAQGFGCDDIHVLPESAATREGIIAAFRRYLIDPAQPGDVALFHFSGHGQRITDDDDADEVDGYDETLVPYDAPMDPPAGYDGNKHLRDDTAGQLVDELRRKLGPQGNVAVFLDSCFSGTGTRGSPVRGGPPIGPPRPGASAEPGKKPGGGFFEVSTRGVAVAPAPGLAPYVVFSASEADQYDHEVTDDKGNLVGPLSYALSKALINLRDARTYRDLLDQIRALMHDWALSASTQQAQLEGDADTLIFSGKTVRQDAYVEVTAVQPDGGGVVLAAGALAGLLPGTEVEIHRSGARFRAEDTLLAPGKVESSTYFTAAVKLARELPPTALKGSRAFVTRDAFGDVRVKVRVDSSVPPSLRSLLATGLAGVAPVQLVESGSDVTVAVGAAARAEAGPIPGSGDLVVFTDTGTDLEVVPQQSPDLVARVTRRLRDFARNRYLRRLNVSDPDFDYGFEIIPVTLSHCQHLDQPSFDTCTVQEHDPHAFTDSDQQLRIPVGTYLKIRVHPGRQPAYGTLLELSPNGDIRILWPLDAAMERFATGSPRALPIAYLVGPPTGLEELRFIATRDWVNFAPFATASGVDEKTRGELRELAPLFDEARIRGGQLFSISHQGVSIRSRLFRIVP
jgi:metacaspase-1